MSNRLFHFSDNDTIKLFHPRPVCVPVERLKGLEWLNGPLVWAIDEWHQPMYMFPSCKMIDSETRRRGETESLINQRSLRHSIPMSPCQFPRAPQTPASPCPHKTTIRLMPT